MREGSYVEAYVHLVWTTKNRYPWLCPELARPIYGAIVAECRVLGADVVALDGTEDHIHLLAKLPATVTIADLARRVKGASSHLVNHPLGREGFRWQDGYAALSVSRWDIPKIATYVQMQEEHHRCGSSLPALEPPIPKSQAP